MEHAGPSGSDPMLDAPTRGAEPTVAGGGVVHQLTARVHTERRVRFWVQVIGMPLLLGAMILLWPIDVATWRRLAVVAVAWAAIPLRIRVISRRPAGVRRSSLTIWDFVAIVACAAIVPDLWVGAVVMVAVLAGHRLGLDPLRAVVIETVLVLIALAAIGWWMDATWWLLAVGSFAINWLAAVAFYKESNDQSARVERRFTELVDNAGLFLWKLDPVTKRFASITGSPEAVLGWTRSELLELGWADLADSDDLFVMLEGHEVEHVVRHRDGHQVVLRSAFRRDGAVMAGRSSDVTSQAALTDALRHQAEHDPLTGLKNRGAFNTALQVAVDPFSGDAAGGLAPAAGVALLLIDLDRFKHINDTLGHQVGDRALCAVAERLQRSIGPEAVLARIGGDEFAIVLADCTLDGAQGVARQIVERAAAPVQLGDVTLAAELSVGIAHAPTHAGTVDELMRCADLATYRAKSDRSQVGTYEPLDGHGDADQQGLIADIPRALDRGEFELWFQPILSLQTLEVVGVEGLARWRHPSLGVLMPGQFLELLDLSDAQQLFANATVEQAIAFIATARDAGHDLRVSVNLGSASFLDVGLAGRVEGLLAVHGVSPSSLTIELTERDVLGESGREWGVFVELAEMGVALSIDDFGTGYSSLDRVRRMPLSELKIDRSFVQRSGDHPADLIIMRTVTDLARLLHLVVVGEGIETVDQLERLRALGCDYGQGFLFSRAIPQSELLEVLRDGLDSVAGLELADTSADEAATTRDDPLRLDVRHNDLGLAVQSADQRERLGLAILDEIPHAVFIKGLDGRFVWRNRHHRESLGGGSGLTGTTSDVDIHDPHDLIGYRADDLSVVATGKPVLDRIEPQTQIDGRVVQVRTTKRPLRNLDGEVIGLFGYSVDVASPRPAKPVRSSAVPNGTGTEQTAGRSQSRRR